MENSMRINDSKTEDMAARGNQKIGNALHTADNLLHSATDFATKFRSVSGDAVRESVSFAKKYPIHTALGAAVVGFFAGFLVKRS